MYAKIFESIYEGSLVEDWKALIVFQQLVVLCDSEGIIDMTPTAISRRTNIPLEIIKHGLKFLQHPDNSSRTPDENGRRIILLDDHRDWGWFIVNHKKYRDLTDYETIKEQNRERQKRYREKRNSNVTVTDGNEQSRHTDTDTDTNTDTIKDKHNVEAKAPTVRNKDIETVLNFLNKKTGKNFQLLNPAKKLTSNALKVKDRLKDGYTIQQCKTVIARKCHDWLESDKMKHCLTPETLFRKSNFDKYIGECVVEN